MNLYACIVALLPLALAIALYASYASVIKRKNKVKEAFSDISVQLKKRYDLIPNILTIAKKYMEYERGIMEDITKLRTEALSISDDYENISKKIKLDKEIVGQMRQLLVSFENYPQLKADTTMVTAMQTYNEVEEHIAAARRFFNSAVNDLNNAVEIFPSSMFASMLGIGAQEFIEIDEKEKELIKVSDYLK